MRRQNARKRHRMRARRNERIFKTQIVQRVRQLQVERDAALYGTYPAREEEDTTREEG